MRKLHTNIFYISIGATMVLMTFMVAKTSAAPSDSQPNTPGAGAPLCLPISVNNKNPKGGETIILTCGDNQQIQLGKSYTFIIHEPDPSKNPPNDFSEIQETVLNTNSFNYTVPRVLGSFSAWCQPNADLAGEDEYPLSN